VGEILITAYYYTDNENSMPEGGMFKLLLQLLNTWQVIAVTVAIALYISLINYVARTHHRPRFVSKSKPVKAKKQPAAKPEKKKPTKADTNDELGIEEA
jgi:hypothetical protein